MTWRYRAASTIRDTLAGLPADADENAVRRALRDAYPFGQREMHPYKVWCEEVRHALNLRFRGVWPGQVRRLKAQDADEDTLTMEF